MAANEFTPGPVTDHVIANVRRLRDELGLSQAQLSARLTEVGRPIRATGIHRLETGKRRIDADDLMGLALAFRVTPISLLLPPTAEGDVALSGSIQSDARAAWEWLRARAPLPAITDGTDEVFERVAFQNRSMPDKLRRYQVQGVGLEAIERN